MNRRFAVIIGVWALLASGWLCVRVTPLAAQDAAFPLVVGDSGRHLVDQRGVPFLIHGDTPWSLTHNLTFEEAVRYMKKRKAQGFNTLLVSTPDAYDQNGDNSYAPDRQGQQPFFDDDVTKPNERYWAHVDRVFREVERMGFLLMVTPAYLGADNDGYVEFLRKAGPRRCHQYGQWIGKRFRHLSNLIWVHGGDRNAWDVRAEVRALALGIREVDDRHLHTAHWTNGTSGLDYFGKEGWLDFNSSYTYGPIAWRVLADRLRHPSKPTFMIESHYENEWGGKTAEDIRAYPYRAILSGATGHMYGSKPTWFCGIGWEEALDSAGARYMTYALALFRSRPWHALEPDAEHQLVVADHWESGTDTGVQAALTHDRSTAIAYLPPERRSIRIDFEQLSGKRVHGYLYNPATGSSMDLGSFERQGSHVFDVPGTNDWVLVLDDEAKHYGAPGDCSK